jgi:addiction module HigA family antidote
MTPSRFNPPHPGTILNDLCLQPLGLNVTQAARSLGVSRTTLSALLRGKTGLRTHMAVRIARVFGPNPENWLQQQMRYDLWRVRQRVDVVGGAALRK